MTTEINEEMQEELEDSPLWTGDLGVNDGAWGRVGYLAVDVGEEPAAYALLHHHHTQLGPTKSRWTNSTSKTGNLRWNTRFIQGCSGERAPAPSSRFMHTLLICVRTSRGSEDTEVFKTFPAEQKLSQRAVKDKNSHIVVPHGLDGVLDLRDLVVDHAVQLTVPDAVSVDDDA